MNPAVRTIVDSLRPCHEPPATSDAVWSVYDTVTADALSMLDVPEVRQWLAGVVREAVCGLPPGVEPASDAGSAAVAAAIVQALST
jgi:hypothetical protein